MNILIADDAAYYRDLMVFWFKKWPEHRLTLAEDGREAWLLLNDPRHQFDAAFLDLNMPHSSGLDVLRQLSESSRHRSLETVICTSYSDRSIIAKAITLGARHYIIKPCTGAGIASKLLHISSSRRASVR